MPQILPEFMCRIELSPMAELEFYEMIPLLAQAVEDGLLSESEAEEIATTTILRGITVTVV